MAASNALVIGSMKMQTRNKPANIHIVIYIQISQLAVLFVCFYLCEVAVRMSGSAWQTCVMSWHAWTTARCRSTKWTPRKTRETRS